jgi:hypothetical protein
MKEFYGSKCESKTNMKIESDQKKASGKIGRTKRKKKIFIDV